MSESGNEVIRREFPATLEVGDGRTLEVRIIPYGEPATVADPPDFVPYEEVFEAGAFDNQLKAPNRVSVFVNVEHEPGIKGIVGRGTQLREVAGDALYGTFRMLDHPDADKALQLVNEGDLVGISAEFVPSKSVRVGNLVRRVKARLVNIALVRPSGSPSGIQAYRGAQVVAVREKLDGLLSQAEEETRPLTDLEKDQAVGFQEKFVEATAERSDVDEILERIGFEPILVRAVTRKPWSGAASKYADTAAYCKACLIDDNPAGEEKTQARCHLPVYEPNGDLNANALGAAAGRLNQTQSPQKAAAARKLVRLYRQAGMEPPPALLSAAGR